MFFNQYVHHGSQFLTTTDEGTKDYNFKAENSNGEITTESTVDETPASDDVEEYAEDDDPDLLFTIEGGELTYLILDE